MRKWFRENSIVLISTVIAVCALGLTIFQGCEQRNHNILSVVPDLGVKVLALPSQDGREAGIYFFNGGLGPARIKALGVSHEDVALQNISELLDLVVASWVSLHPEEEPADLRSGVYMSIIPFGQELSIGLLPAGEDYTLLSFSNSVVTKEFTAFLTQFFSKLTFRAAWKSIYGENFRRTYTSCFTSSVQTESSTISD